MGISFSPEYCYRILKPQEDVKWISEGRDSLEIGKFGYTSGLALEYKINEKLHIATGIYFTDGGERTKKYSIENVPYGQESIKYSYNNHYQYLSVPLKINYFFIKKKFDFYLTGGLFFNVFLNEITVFTTHYAKNNNKVIENTNSGFSKLNFGLIAGFGMNYQINPKSTFVIEPNYRRSISSIVDAPVKSYLYSLGVNIGVLFKI